MDAVVGGLWDGYASFDGVCIFDDFLYEGRVQHVSFIKICSFMG